MPYASNLCVWTECLAFSCVVFSHLAFSHSVKRLCVCVSHPAILRHVFSCMLLHQNHVSQFHVLHFLVMHFYVLLFSPSFSRLAFSHFATWCTIFTSYIFTSCILHAPIIYLHIKHITSIIFNFNCYIKTEGLLIVTGSHVHCKNGNISRNSARNRHIVTADP